MSSVYSFVFCKQFHLEPMHEQRSQTIILWASLLADDIRNPWLNATREENERTTARMSIELRQMGIKEEEKQLTDSKQNFWIDLHTAKLKRPPNRRYRRYQEIPERRAPKTFQGIGTERRQG